MLSDPSRECLAVDRAGGDAEDHALRVVHPGIELMSIENKEHLHRRMPDALVPVDEGVVPDQ